jgi:hypothetical protein
LTALSRYFQLHQREKIQYWSGTLLKIDDYWI